MRAGKGYYFLIGWLSIGCIAFGTTVYAGVDPRILKAKKTGIVVVPEGTAQGSEQTAIPQQQPSPAAPIEPTPPQEEPQDGREDFSAVIRELKVSSRIWPEISSAKTKELAIAYFVSDYKDNGMAIRKPPAHYIGFIDDMLAQTPDFLSLPFAQVLQFAAIVEYDFDNGNDKDEMARRLLGDEGFQRNKERLGIP